MNAVSPPDRVRWCGKTRGREGKEGQPVVRRRGGREGVQGESDSQYKWQKRPAPQRATEIAPNDEGPGGGGLLEGTEGGRAFKVAHNAGSLGHRSVSYEDGCWTGHEEEEEEEEHGGRDAGGRREDRWIEVWGRRQDIDRGGIVLQELACQKYVSVMQIGWERKKIYK